MVWLVFIGGIMVGYGLSIIVRAVYPSKDDELLKDYLRREYVKRTYGRNEEPEARRTDHGHR